MGVVKKGDAGDKGEECLMKHSGEHEKDMLEALRVRYVNEMKDLQFLEFEMAGADGEYRAHHFASQITAEKSPAQAKIMRLAQEVSVLCSALPCDLACSMFMRCDEERTDVITALILGPVDTPYESGAFEFHVYVPPSYPTGPPKVNLETTGKGAIRFNPNLYNCGKVCLSLLGTWSGGAGENWDAKVSMLLQVMVSVSGNRNPNPNPNPNP